MSKKYDADQLKAINATGGAFLVLAPPGCGKTDILAERIARALDYGVQPADMLCLTFTNRASRGMRDRVTTRLGNEHPDAAREIFIGNLHRFCSIYLYSNAVIPENSFIIDEDDQADILNSINKNITTSQSGMLSRAAVKYIADLAAYILQRRMGHPADVLPEGPGILDRESGMFLGRDFNYFYKIAETYNFVVEDIPTDYETLRVAMTYNFYKSSRCAIDFADLLILAYEHMRHNPDLKKYPWIQIDEVQDLNRLQLAIADIVTAPGATAMYLGDEQQAIFSFMGAKLSNLDILRQRCRGHILSLGANYRSPSYLLDICNTYAKEVLHVAPELLPQPTRTETPGEYDLIIAASKSPSAENERVRRMVEYYLSLDPEKKERLAILVGRNAQADEISAALTNGGTPNFKISGKDMFRSRSFKTLGALYSVLVNDFDMGAWTRLLYGVKATGTQVMARELVNDMRKLMLTPSDFSRRKPYLQEFTNVYRNGEAVVFDTETTGLNVLEDDIVQIAAFKIRGGAKVPGSDFNIILHTDRPIPEKLGDLDNPLTAEYASRPHLSRKEGLQAFLDYAKGHVLIGHNVTYDYLILCNNCSRELGIAIDFPTLDTLHLAKLVAPNLKKYTLASLISTFGLAGENAHLADADIEATLSLIEYCIEKAASAGMANLQYGFLWRPEIQKVADRLKHIFAYMDKIKSTFHIPISISGHNIDSELALTYSSLVKGGVIKSLGPKFDSFIKYVKSEWTDTESDTTIHDQVARHIYDITATINEGDLINCKAKTDKEIADGDGSIVNERVFVMTIHKAKGLEFDNVVILGATSGNYPFFANMKVLRDQDSTPGMKAAALAACEEDARKLYVALSRARKRLCISYYQQGLYSHPTRLSPFLSCIADRFRHGQ